jgi:hypothetical protein
MVPHMKLHTKLLFFCIFIQIFSFSLAMESDSSTSSSPSTSPMITSSTPTQPVTPRSLSPAPPARAADLKQHDAALINKATNATCITDAQQAIAKLHATYEAWHIKQEYELENQRDQIDKLVATIADRNVSIGELQTTIKMLTRKKIINSPFFF